VATLADVIIRLKKEGDLNRNSGTHSLRSVKELMVALNESLTVSLIATVDLISNPMMPLSAPLEQDNDDDTGPADTEKEEDRREQNGVWERLIDTLEGVGKGLESFSDSVMDMVGNVAKGASIAGLLTLFLSPETAIELLGGAMEVFNDAVTAITGILDGDYEGLKEFIKKNPFIAFGATLLLVIKSIGIVGSILTSLAGIGPALVTMGAAVSSVLSFLGIGLLPLVAIGVALYALYKGLQDAVDVFMETGSIMDAFQAYTATFFSTLIGIPLNFVKSAISTIAGLFGFDLVEKELDNIDFQKIIADSINDVLTSIRDAFNDMFDFIVDIPNKIVQIVKRGVASILPEWVAEKLGILPDSMESNYPPSDKTSDKKINITTINGEEMSVTQDELVDMIGEGQVTLEAARVALDAAAAAAAAEAEAAKKFNVTTNSGEKISVTKDELTELVISREVSKAAAQSALGIDVVDIDSNSDRIRKAQPAAESAEDLMDLEIAGTSLADLEKKIAKAQAAVDAYNDSSGRREQMGLPEWDEGELESLKFDVIGAKLDVQSKKDQMAGGTGNIKTTKTTGMGKPQLRPGDLTEEEIKSGTFENDVLVQPNEVDDLGMNPPLAFIVPDSNLSSNLSVDGNVNSSLTTAQAENNALTTSTSSAIQALSPVLAAVSSGGSVGGGKSTSNTAVANTTNINSTNSPDNISREWSFRPA
jgi:hypothetical protein